MADGLHDHSLGVAIAVAKAEGYDRLLKENERLRRGLRQALGLIDELERDIGQEIRGVAYYELRKLLERTGPQENR